MVDTLSSAILSEGKKITDVVKYEADQTHCRIEGALGVDVGFDIGDVVELISSKYEKVVTGTNAAGIFLSRKDTALSYATADINAAGGTIAADDTVVIGGRTYTYKAVPSAADEIDVGSDDDESLDNLVSAINKGVGATTAYIVGSPDEEHDDVTAEIRPGDIIRLRAKTPGAAGNSVTLVVTGTALGVSSATLLGGKSLDPAKGVILTRGPATIVKSKLDYNSATVTDVDTALLTLGIKGI